jgi:hypothetical protein
MHTTRSTTRSTARRLAGLLLLPLAALGLGACTVTSYDTTANRVSVTMAAGADCNLSTKTCTNNGLSWMVTQVIVTDGSGARRTYSPSTSPELRAALATCGYTTGCGQTAIAQASLPWGAGRPCGAITTRVDYLATRTPSNPDSGFTVTERATADTGRSC